MTTGSFELETFCSKQFQSFILLSSVIGRPSWLPSYLIAVEFYVSTRSLVNSAGRMTVDGPQELAM